MALEPSTVDSDIYLKGFKYDAMFGVKVSLLLIYLEFIRNLPS
jgi:hypothetical protein